MFVWSYFQYFQNYNFLQGGGAVDVRFHTLMPFCFTDGLKES